MPAETAVVLLAGGSGTRMQRTENKVYLQVGGRTLLAWSLENFERASRIHRIVLVIREGDEHEARRIAEEIDARKLVDIVRGGSTRHESEQAGLEALAQSIEADEISLVCIHDAARPFVAEALLDQIIEAADRFGGAVPGLPLDGEFLLRADDDGSAPAPVATRDLRRVQTPQAFHARPLLDAYRRASEAGFHGVDTAESVERFSDLAVRIVPGDPDNVKVTYLEDLVTADELAQTWHRSGD